MERLWRDLAFGLRGLIKTPAFTTTAVLSLALGIGLNTAIFSVVNTLFLNPLPVEKSSELVAVFTRDANNSAGPFSSVLQSSYPNYKDYRDGNQVFSSLAAYTFPQTVMFSTGGEPSAIVIEVASGNYFPTLGVTARKGRVFGPADDGPPGSGPVLVISHALWQQRLGAAEDVLGKAITLNGMPFTIVGVAPEGFRGVNSLFGPDGWVPMSMYPTVSPSSTRNWLDERRALAFNLVGRLRPGTTITQAAANFTAIAKSLEEQYPAPNRGRSAVLKPLAEATIFPGLRDALLVGGGVLMVIVGLVLLIACSNIANLLLARASARGQEIAVRIALGASRPRLIRQLMTESLLLGVIGGAFGLLVARWSLQVIMATRPPFFTQNFLNVEIDGRVLLFAFLISLLTGVLFGLAPALQASRSDVVVALKEQTRGAGRRRRTFGLANLLIVGQVALSLIALITAALFLRSSQTASTIDPGFDTEHVAVMTISPGQQGYDQGRAEQFDRDLLERLRSLPGVQSVSWSTSLPLFGFARRSIVLEGQDPSAQAAILAAYTAVDVNFFATAGIGFVRGRDFTEADRAGSQPVAIVNDTMARRFWPGQDPIGKRFRYFTEKEFREVVGIVKTVKTATLGEDPQPAAYSPLRQAYSDTLALYVRGAGDPASLIEPVRRTILQVDPRMPIQNPQVVKEVVAQSLWAVRVGAVLLGVFGGLALALACIGLYGVMSYSVGQRTRELGLRMALGADPIGVLRLVLRQGLTLVGVGVALGLAGALAASRLVASVIYGSPTDVVSFAGASLALIAVATIASLLPAQRASRVDPIIALRE